jgi:hypothetical protein
MFNLKKWLSRQWRRLVVVFDFHVVYALFFWRFTPKLKANPRMRQALIDSLEAWGETREAEVAARRAALRTAFDRDAHPRE